jgi:hypothetical protein
MKKKFKKALYVLFLLATTSTVLQNTYWIFFVSDFPMYFASTIFIMSVLFYVFTLSILKCELWD